jgi:hypothetical protein
MLARACATMIVPDELEGWLIINSNWRQADASVSP